MPLYACKKCKETYPALKSYCAECDTWGQIAELKLLDSVKAVRVPLDSKEETPDPPRILTGILGLDLVLGGGLVQDSLIILGGEPGVGKSTLILELVRGLRSHYKKLRILYASGEESVSQIRSRARRMNVKGGEATSLFCETWLESILEETRAAQAKLLIVDSIQTLVCDEEAPPGSPHQLREVASGLMRFAKAERVAVILVGHVTKDGELAGPKMVEHLVDAVLSFEASQNGTARRLSTTKNRFGSTQNQAYFQMNESGLREIGQEPDSSVKS